MSTEETKLPTIFTEKPLTSVKSFNRLKPIQERNNTIYKINKNLNNTSRSISIKKSKM